MNLPSQKYWSVYVTFMHVSTHQKHHVHPGHNTQNALDVFNTLRIFTHEPIREQEIK